MISLMTLLLGCSASYDINPRTFSYLILMKGLENCSVLSTLRTSTDGYCSGLRRKPGLRFRRKSQFGVQLNFDEFCSPNVWATSHLLRTVINNKYLADNKIKSTYNSVSCLSTFESISCHTRCKLILNYN